MKDLSIKKLYYSISEVSKITEVEQYVLRYWETEFEELNPQKNRAGNRIYTNKDIQLILKIKNLLRDKKYTIEGAKNIIAEFDSGDDPEPVPKSSSMPEIIVNSDSSDLFNEKDPIKNDLLEIKNILEFLLSKL